MATFRRRNGKWQVQIRRKGLTPISKLFELKADARLWATELERHLDTAPTSFDPGALKRYLVRDILIRYRDTITVKKRGRDVEALRIEQFLKHSLSDLSLAEISSVNFAQYRDQRLERVSSGTVLRELAIWQNVFERARLEWGLPLPLNPLKHIAKPAPSKARDRRLAEDEEPLLFHACEQARNKLILPIVVFALETAMRRGEILSIQINDWNDSERMLTIDETKNGESRTIPLTTKANRILQKRRCEGRRFFPISANAFRLAWCRTVKRAGITDLRFHDLRHEAISRFFEIGLSLPEVALISGHKTYSQLARYTHLKPSLILSKLK